MINTRHTEYANWFLIWEKTRDGVSGQEAVHARRTKYLPQLGGQTDEVYRSYLQRAQYVNFSARTVNAALGQLFRKDPVCSLPDEYKENIDLAGSSFYHYTRDIAKECMLVNRVGILLDYSDILNRPYLTDFKAENIINGRTEIVNGSEVLTLVVLEGLKQVIDTTDKYSVKSVEVWTELYLDKGIYKVRDWRKEKDNFIADEERIPLMSGKPLNWIPFYFVTSEGITHKLTKSAMVDFVNVNLGHYVNSADYENMIHWAGQKTVITTGWGDKPFPIGGNANLSDGGQASYLESASDSCIEKAMQKKEEQMAALGSQIITGKGRYVASAETSKITSQGEHATLADIANSLSYCFDTILRAFMLWDTGKDTEIDVEFNTDFSVDDIPQGKLIELMGAVQSGYMSYETFFYQLKNYELYPANWTIEDEKKGIEESTSKQAAQREADTMNAISQLMARETEEGEA